MEKLMVMIGVDAGAQQRYLATFQRSDFLAPEKLLMVAILEDAIHLYRKYQGSNQRGARTKFNEVRQWIMRRGNNWIFSFDNVCDLLGLDPAYVRRSLRESESYPGGEAERPRRHARHRQAA